MSGVDALERLPAARSRLEQFGRALERIHIDDLSLYVARQRQPDHRRAVESAAVAALQAGLDDAVDEARHVLVEYVTRQFAVAQIRISFAGLNSVSGLGSTDDRVRIMRSIGDAAAAIVLWDELDEADRAELLGLWARLIP